MIINRAKRKHRDRRRAVKATRRRAPRTAWQHELDPGGKRVYVWSTGRRVFAQVRDGRCWGAMAVVERNHR